MRRSTNTFWSYGLPALLIPLLLDPAAGIAQMGTPPPGEATAPAMAKSMQSEAASILEVGDRSNWDEAATLLVQAAESWGYGTPDAVESLRKAAYLRYYLGEHRLALELMEEAAGQAIATGQVLQAANSYIDGVWLAIELDRTSNAMELGAKAKLLAESPHLTEVDRGSILGRVDGYGDSFPSADVDTF